MLDIGYKNYIDPDQIDTVIDPYSSRAKWLKKEAVEGQTLINCTQGRKTNTLIILKTGHLVLSSLKYNSLIRRIKATRTDIKTELKTVEPDDSISAKLLKALEKIEK